MQQCCGITTKGVRCKKKTLNILDSYGINFNVCNLHTNQNVILEWSKNTTIITIPKDIDTYLNIYYHLSQKLEFMKEVPLVMLTTFLFKRNSRKRIKDCITQRFVFYEDIFKEHSDDKTPEECPVCFEDSEVATPCNHSFCRSCIYNWADVKGTCPLCRSQFLKIF